MRTTAEKNRFEYIDHEINAAESTATTIPATNAGDGTPSDQLNRLSRPAVTHVATGPSRTTMPTIGLSHFFPAFTLLRSASKSGLRANRAMLARLAPKLSARSTHAFGHFRRPND